MKLAWTEGRSLAHAWATTLCFVLLLGAQGGVHAQQNAAADAAGPIAQARRLCDKAMSLRRTGRPALALALYDRAYALVPTPVILVSKVEVYKNLGRNHEALDLAERIPLTSLPKEGQRELLRLRERLRNRRLPSPDLLPSSMVADMGPASLGDPASSPRSGPGLTHRGLAVSKWTLGVVSLAAVITSIALLVVEGTPNCSPSPGQQECSGALHTRTAGIGLLVAGMTGMAATGLLFNLDHRPGPQQTGDAGVVATVRF